MPVFTTENAREYALKGNEVRWSREKEVASRIQTPPVAAAIAEPLAEIQNERRARMIATKEAQMDKLDEDINDCNDPKMLHFLTGSRERLFNEWCVLTGTAKPAPRKSQDKPSRQRGGTFVDPT